jgi:hypothetical protein
MTEKRFSRAGLFAPFILVFIVLAAWTVWWFYLSGQVRDRIEVQMATLNRAGWSVSHSQTEIGGWPFRVRVSLGETRIAAPSGQALSSTELVAQANAWNPATWVIASPGDLVLTRADKGDIAIGGQARMSLHGLSQRWPNIAVELIRPTFTPVSDADTVAEPFPLARAGLIQFYLRPHLAPAGTSGSNTSVDVLFRLMDAEGRAGGPVAAFAQNGKLTAQIEAVVEGADRITGADPSGVFAAWSLNGGRFSRIRGEISAGDSRARLSSESLMAGPDGRLEGNVTLEATRPLPALIGLLRSGGATGPLLNTPMGQAALDGLAGSGPSPAGAPEPTEDVNLSLAFREGRTWLGPFALAPAPKLF